MEEKTPTNQEKNLGKRTKANEEHNKKSFFQRQ